MLRSEVCRNIVGFNLAALDNAIALLMKIDRDIVTKKLKPSDVVRHKI